MTEYDEKVLREIAGEHQSDLFWGAAMSVALGYLQGSGYVTRGSTPKITNKGRDYLAGRPVTDTRTSVYDIANKES